MPVSNRRDAGFVAECRKRMSGRVIAVMILGILSVAVIILAIVFHTLPNEDSSSPFLQLHPSPGDGDLPLIYVDAHGKWKQWAETLDEFIDGYSLTDEEASRLSSCFNLADGESAPNDTSCFFDVKVLGRCSFKGDRVYGYDVRQPCVYLNPNKFDGWEPEYYKNISEVPEKVPKQLLDAMEKEAGQDGKLPARLWISCEGKTPSDKESMGPVEYLPHQYFASYYFPYRKGALYHPPIVAVRFKDLNPGILIHVICRAWARNIEDMRPSVQWEMLFD